MLISFLKEFIIATKQILISFLVRNEYNKTLFSEGIIVKSDKLTKEQVLILKNEIDNHFASKETNVWNDKYGADKRIYGFEKLSNYLFDFIDVDSLKKIGQDFTGSKFNTCFAVAGKIKAVAGNVGSGGGWHRDSPFRHQFKVIFYLSDVDNENGPFEYIKNSHTSYDKFLALAHTPLDCMRFSTEHVNNYFLPPKSYTANSGTMLLVDTRGIHRGRPIELGERYALTLYFFENEPPKQFESLLQKEIG